VVQTLRGGARSFRGSEQELLDEAIRRTGLSDYAADGDADFRDGLRFLLEGYDEEARLNPFGRMNVRQELLGVLCARLNLVDQWKRNPEVLEAPVVRPIFVLGLPRTGTSALHDLLAEDPNHQVLEYWLAASPTPRPVAAISSSDPRLKAARRELRTIYALDPGMRALHDMQAEGPEECRHLFRHNFLDDTFDSMATLPSYGKWFRSQGVSHVYDWHRNALRLVQSTAREKRWILKYPAHMRNLELLLRTYPDACIVQTHRDPVHVLPSICSLVYRMRCLYSDDVDPRVVGRWQLEMWADVLERCLDVRKRQDPARFHDIYFSDFQRDPVAAIRGIHEHFDWEQGSGDATNAAPAENVFDDESAERIRRYRAAHPKGQHGSHHYSAEDYGLSSGEIRERFSSYSEAFEIDRHR
jgi:hypothetical protein